MKFIYMANGRHNLLPGELGMLVGVRGQHDSDLDEFVAKYKLVIVKRYPETQNAKYINGHGGTEGHILQPAIVRLKEEANV